MIKINKVIICVAILFMTCIMWGCNKERTKEQAEGYIQEAINYITPSVTETETDFDLISEHDQVSINWESSNPDVLTISKTDDKIKAIVTQSDKDEIVALTAILSCDYAESKKVVSSNVTFNITVIKYVSNEDKAALVNAQINLLKLDITCKSGYKVELPLLDEATNATYEWVKNDNTIEEFDLSYPIAPCLDKDYTISLDVIMSVGNASKTIEKSINVENNVPDSIKEHKLIANILIDDDHLTHDVTFNGVITFKNEQGIVVTDEVSSIFIEKATDLLVSDTVEVTGKMYSIDNTILMDSDTKITKVENVEITPKNPSVTTLEAFNSLVHKNGGLSGLGHIVNGQLVKVNDNFYIQTGNTKLTCHQKFITESDKLLLDSKVNKSVNVLVYVYKFDIVNKNYQVMINMDTLIIV